MGKFLTTAAVRKIKHRIKDQWSFFLARIDLVLKKFKLFIIKRASTQIWKGVRTFIYMKLLKILK